MSTLQRKGRIGISLVLALLMVFSVVATVSAADTAANSIVAPTVGPDYAGNSTIYAYGGGDSASKDSWISWKGASDGTKYLCLPSSVDRNVYFYSTYSSNVTVENIKDASDKFTLTSNAVSGPFAIGTTKTYQVKSGSTVLYTLKFRLSEAEGALFITTTDKNGNYVDNWNYLCQDKENSSAGRWVVSANGGTSKLGDLKKIKGRGNSTWTKSKKPFNITLDSKEKLLGMNKGKKFSLLANYQEGTLMRNRLLYDMADEVGLNYSPDSRFVEFYVNGSYKGSYQMSEKVELGKDNMVKITDLEKNTEEKAIEVTGDPDYDVYGIYETEEHQVQADYNGGKIYYYDIPAEYNPDDITGGYLFECDTKANSAGDWNKFETPKGQVVTVKSPAAMTEAQVKYLYDYYVAMETAVYGTTDTYKNYMDIESVAKAYMIAEVGKNIDGGITSTDFYKDAATGQNGGKISGGPVWDYDCAIGNLYGSRKSVSGVTYNTNDPIGWFNRYIQNADNGKVPTIFAAACQHADFWTTVKTVWNDEFVDAIKVANGEQAAAGSRMKSIAEYSAMLQKSADMNYLFNPFPYYNNNGDFTWIPCTDTTYTGHVAFMQNWLNTRAEWLNTKLGTSTTQTIYYNNSFTNWSKVYAYAWNDGDGTTNAAWPGQAMTAVVGTNGYYKLDLGLFDHVIFNNGTNGQTIDLDLAADSYVFKSNAIDHTYGGTTYYKGEWSKFDNTTKTIYFDNAATNWTNLSASYWGGGVDQAWPGTAMTLVSGTIYKVEIPGGCTNIIFNNGGNKKQTATLVPQDGKLYVASNTVIGTDYYGNSIYGGDWASYTP